MTLPQGKIQDEFLGCRRRERLQPTRPTPKKQKAFLGTLWADKEYLARVIQWQVNHRTQARHTYPALEMALAEWIPACRGNEDEILQLPQRRTLYPNRLCL